MRRKLFPPEVTYGKFSIFFDVSTFKIMWQRKKERFQGLPYVLGMMGTGSCLLEPDYLVWMWLGVMTGCTWVHVDKHRIPWYGFGFDKLSFYWIDRKKKRPDWFIDFLDFSFFFRPRDSRVTRFEKVEFGIRMPMYVRIDFKYICIIFVYISIILQSDLFPSWISKWAI